MDCKQLSLPLLILAHIFRWVGCMCIISSQTSVSESKSSV